MSCESSAEIAKYPESVDATLAKLINVCICALEAQYTVEEVRTLLKVELRGLDAASRSRDGLPEGGGNSQPRTKKKPTYDVRSSILLSIPSSPHSSSMDKRCLLLGLPSLIRSFSKKT